MRTFGKNDFKDFEFVRDDTLGKFYKVFFTKGEEPRTMLIVEADTLEQAFAIMRDCFLYNRGHSTHPNLLHFDGCFLSELKEDTNAFF